MALPATRVLLGCSEQLLAFDHLHKLQEEGIGYSEVGAKLLRRDARGIQQASVFQQLRLGARTAVSLSPQAASALHTRGVLV